MYAQLGDTPSRINVCRICLTFMIHVNHNLDYNYSTETRIYLRRPVTLLNTANQMSCNKGDKFSIFLQTQIL
jgi:hypothetical protein